MKKILLALVAVLVFALPVHAFDAVPYNINSTAGSGGSAVTNTTTVCLVAYNLSCGGACAVQLRKHIPVYLGAAVASSTIYATLSLAGAGVVSQTFADVNGCGGGPGIALGKGLYPYTLTASTTNGTIWYYKR